MKHTARGVAVEMLDMVLGQGQLIRQCTAISERLAPNDRARARRLTLQVLRHIEPADRVLAPFLRKTPALFVHNILRLGTVELAMGQAAHGVVNEMVALTRAHPKYGAMSGLVNAILRKVATPDNPFAKYPPQRLPFWLRKPLVDHYGRDAVNAIEAIQAQNPPIDLTLNPNAQGSFPEGVMLPNGSLRLYDAPHISALPGYDTGDWWVQDCAAAFACALLAPQKGEHILDLCAAPGGKTLQLAGAGAVITALDSSEARLERLHDNLARTKLTAQVIAADALNWQPDGRFDAVLLDAPCSANGTIRRHPDLPFVKNGDELTTLLPLQAALLDRAFGWLKPGGRLVYCTCSLDPREGEGQITAALARHPALRIIPRLPKGAEPDWRNPDGTLRLRPDYWADQGGMDGFFMALLTLG